MIMLKKEISIQICKLDNALNANEACPWMLMRKYLLAILILLLIVLMLIIMLLNLNTGYADTDADLCIRIMSLCCNEIAKIHLQNLNIFVYRTAEPILAKFGTNILGWGGIHVCSNEEPFNSYKVNNGVFFC